MNQPTPTDFLLGSSAGSAFGKHDPIGKTVTGTVVSTEVRQQTKMETGTLMFWDDGQPMMQLVVTISTDERDPTNPDDNGKRSIYVKGSTKAGSKSLHDAVAGAVRASGAKDLDRGGTLTVRFIGTEPSSTRGFNDRKLWAAKYEPPAAGAGDFLGTTQAPTTAPQAAPVDPWATTPPQQAQAVPAAPF